ncbi:MAG: adenylate/guanylate cyclase domain-containing protein [Holosporaceae bacterium]|nr:adenylate/guanylate cyclase domain-containing protein [Holosporaceae bacterium]
MNGKDEDYSSDKGNKTASESVNSEQTGVSSPQSPTSPSKVDGAAADEVTDDLFVGSANASEVSGDGVIGTAAIHANTPSSTVAQASIATEISDGDNLEDDGEELDEASSSCDDIENNIMALIATGHMFKAHVIAKKAFQKHPRNAGISQAYALVLLKTGAVEEALKLIYPILGVDPRKDESTGAMGITVADLLASKFLRDGSPYVIANIGHIFKESWKYSHYCRNLEISRELYLASFKKEKKTRTGMQAAWLAWLTGDDSLAKQLASEVLKLLPPFGMDASFSELVDLSEAQLLLGREDDACKFYEEAMKQSAGENYISIVAARQQLCFLREAGFRVPHQTLEILIPPTIVVFTGHMIDHPSFQVSLFSQEIEEDIKRIITEKLRSLNAKIGYSSASCGADIIFIEALQSLGGEANIILPFAISDFVETNVRYAGPRWEKRFENAIASAHSVSFACEDRYLGHDMLYRFSNHVMYGSAVMRGKFLTTEPNLMAVWHSRTDSAPGGPTDFIDRWTNISTLHLIDLDELGENTGSADKIDPALIKAQKFSLTFDPFISKSPDRVIRSMMFSDIHGYSKLQDEHIPSFLDFMDKLHIAIEKIGMSLESLNTWGDAVFAVADNPLKIADFSLRYCDVVETLGSKYPEFPLPIRARISLHAGPVFVAEDPFIKKINFFGGHINRAARLEPVTAVGQVYATQQFVALLYGATNDERNECVQKELKYYERYSMEYVGIISLAKSYGQQEVYHLRWR